MKAWIRRKWFGLVRWFVDSWIRTGLQKRKSMLGRRLFERRFFNVPISTFERLPDLCERLDASKWRADSWRVGFEHISHPGKGELIFNGGFRADRDFDCDDFASWICAAILASKGKGFLQEISDVALLSVIYSRGPGLAVGGHTVAMIYDHDARGFRWIDYGPPSRTFKNARDLCGAIAETYSKGNGGAVLGVVLTPDLDYVCSVEF